jgi:hypothetical protein
MRPDLAALASRQHGLVTRAQALDHGYRERELRTLTKPGGEWHTVRRGVYCLRALWTSYDERGQQRLRVLAVLLTARKPVVASHASAALLHGLDLLTLDELVHMTRTGVLGGRTEHGVDYHPARIDPVDVVRVLGHDCTSLARTAVDVAREQGYLEGLVVADQVLRLGVPLVELERVVEGMVNWPHVTRARAVVADADGRAGSVAETVARPVITELGFGRPQLQFAITDGLRTAYADFRISWHTFEMDGKVKYDVDGPFANGRTAQQILWDEKQREDFVRGEEYGVTRFGWADLWGRRRRDLLARCHRDVAATRRRVGEQAWAVGLEETRAALPRVS